MVHEARRVCVPGRLLNAATSHPIPPGLLVYGVADLSPFVTTGGLFPHWPATRLASHCVSRPVCTDGGVKRRSAPPTDHSGGASLDSRRSDLLDGGPPSPTRRGRPDRGSAGAGGSNLSEVGRGAAADRRLSTAVLGGIGEGGLRRPHHRADRP